MKIGLSKKIFSLLLCCCFVFLAGCGDGTSDNGKQVSGNAKSTDSSSSISGFDSESTGSTSTTATTNKNSETKPSNPSTNPSVTVPTQKPVDVGNGEKLIALTFDDGPHTSVTMQIVNTLEKHGAKATFFVVGNRANYDAAALKKAVSIGCEVGSHTHSHKNLTKLTPAQIAEEMNNSAKSISDVTGVPVTLMRPPEGAHNETVRNNLNYPLIMWSVDSMDWKYRDAQKDYDAIMNTVFDGSIILMHDLYPATAAAVEKLIPDLMAKGYKFVTVSELMAARGITMQAGKTYSAARP